MKKIKFARVGGLSPVIQEGYRPNTSERGFHTPPARKGIYAFVYPYIDPFLLSGDWSKLGAKNKHEKFEYLKDTDGNRIKYYAVDWDYENDKEPEINPILTKFFKKGKYSNINRNHFGDEISEKYWQLPIRDKKGNIINEYLVIKKKLKTFYHTGELWHHLNNSVVKPFEILDEIGSWIKTDYDTYVRAFDRDRIECMKSIRKSNFFGYTVELNTKNIYRFAEKDHLEVFIERLKQ